MKLWKKMYSVLLMGTILILSCKCDDADADFTMDNQEFVSKASSSNQFEIAAGNLALTKGLNPEVKQYGSHMVNDHTAVGQEMAKLASSKSLTVPTELASKEKKNLEILSSLTGAAFDKEFASQMVISHQEAIHLFTMAASNVGVRDGDLRNFAAGKLPALRMHLDEAIALQKKI